MSDMQQPTPPPVPPPAEKPKRAKRQSRAARWADATGKALEAINTMSNYLDELESALSDLRSVQEEYEEWKDNLPENLQSSPLGDKLNEVCDLTIEDLADSLRNAIEEAQGNLETAESIDLPQGFGRD